MTGGSAVQDKGEWIEIRKSRWTNPLKRNNPTFYHNLSNHYARLPEYAADPPDIATSHPPDNSYNNSTGTILPVPSQFKMNKQRRKFLERQQKRKDTADLNDHLEQHIQWSEDERTDLEKTCQSKGQLVVNALHNMTKHAPVSILRNGRNVGYAFSTSIRRAFQRLQQANHVRFNDNINQVHVFHIDNIPSITYDSGADGHYLNEDDRHAAQLPILCPSTKQVAVANGQISTANHETQLPFDGLSAMAKRADTFNDFPQSLMSVSKVADDGAISIFTKGGVTVHREEDVLITCKGAPILIGVRDAHGRYRVPLMQTKGNWKPRAPSKRARKKLEQANSVYDSPSTEQAIKWMHSVCGYPVKSTWLKAIKAGNFVGWP